MSRFEQHYEEWLQEQIQAEKGSIRLEFLNKGLGHGTVEFLRSVWFPAIGNFKSLYAEWEVRDFNNGYRYLDLAYMPGGAKGGIEIQGFGPHARDLDVRRFKDLCRRHCLLALDGWTFLPIAYPSITEEPQLCQQLVLAFIGRFAATDVAASLSWLEAETVAWPGVFFARLLRWSWPRICGYVTVKPDAFFIIWLISRSWRWRVVQSGFARISSGSSVR